MITTDTGRFDFIKPGLALAAFFGWILSFPFFGCLLLEAAGADALLLGLVFVISLGLGLLLSALFTANGALFSFSPVFAGAICAALTVTYAFSHGSLLIDALIMVLLGFVTAYLLLVWTTQFSVNSKPLEILTLAMAGANIIVALVNLAAWVPVQISLSLLALPALGGVLLFERAVPGEKEKKIFPVKRENSSAMIKPLAAYAVAVYLLGGIWYNTFSLQPVAAPFGAKSVNFILYSIGIVLLALMVRYRRAAALASYSLSFLGLALIMSLAGRTHPFLVWCHHTAFNFGFAAADLFFWLALWFLAQTYPGRRVFGLGLGVSLFLIGLSTALAAAEYACGAPLLIFLTALVLLFLLVPVLSRNPFRLMNQPAAAPASAGDPRPSPPVVPGILTPAEKRVYLYLIEGAGDTEIAEALFITRHTVKFHVRNILRKLKAKNRKELIVQTIAGQRYPGVPE